MSPMTVALILLGIAFLLFIIGSMAGDEIAMGGSFIFMFGFVFVILQTGFNNADENREQKIIAEIEDTYDVGIETDSTVTNALDNALVPATIYIEGEPYEDTYSITYDHEYEDYEIIKINDHLDHAPDPEELLELANQ